MNLEFCRFIDYPLITKRSFCCVVFFCQASVPHPPVTYVVSALASAAPVPSVCCTRLCRNWRQETGSQTSFFWWRRWGSRGRTCYRRRSDRRTRKFLFCFSFVIHATLGPLDEAERLKISALLFCFQLHLKFCYEAVLKHAEQVLQRHGITTAAYSKNTNCAATKVWLSSYWQSFQPDVSPDVGWVGFIYLFFVFLSLSSLSTLIIHSTSESFPTWNPQTDTIWRDVAAVCFSFITLTNCFSQKPGIIYFIFQCYKHHRKTSVMMKMFTGCLKVEQV